MKIKHLSLIFIVVLLTYGCINKFNEKTTNDIQTKDNQRIYKREDFFKGNIYLNTAPLLEKEVELIFSFSKDLINQVNSSNPIIKLDMPSDISINGHTQWEDVEGTEVKTKITVKNVGEYKIKAYIKTIFPSKEGFNIHEEAWEYFLCFKTTEDSADIIDCSKIKTEGIVVEKIK